MARKLAALAVLACALLALAPEAFAQYRGGLGPPESATERGSAINELYWIVTTLIVFVFVLVEAALLRHAVHEHLERFRDVGRQRDDPGFGHRNAEA